MKNNFPVDITAVLSVIILLLYSCTQGSCFEDTEAFVKATFYDDISKEIHAPDSVTIYGLGMKTAKLYNRAPNVKTALIPLNAATESCTYIISINGNTDTLVFRYSSYPHLISKECGYTFFYDIEQPETKTNVIKGIFLNRSNIKIGNFENIRIFY